MNALRAPLTALPNHEGKGVFDEADDFIDSAKSAIPGRKRSFFIVDLREDFGERVLDSFDGLLNHGNFPALFSLQIVGCHKNRESIANVMISLSHGHETVDVRLPMSLLLVHQKAQHRRDGGNHHQRRAPSEPVKGMEVPVVIE